MKAHLFYFGVSAIFILAFPFPLIVTNNQNLYYLFFTQFLYYLIIKFVLCHLFHFNLMLYRLNQYSSHLETLHSNYQLTLEVHHSFSSLALSAQPLILIFQELNSIQFLLDSCQPISFTLPFLIFQLLNLTYPFLFDQYCLCGCYFVTMNLSMLVLVSFFAF